MADITARRSGLASRGSARIAWLSAGLTVTMFAADQILGSFAARLQDAVELGTVRDELTRAVHAALEPAHLSVWIREP